MTGCAKTFVEKSCIFHHSAAICCRVINENVLGGGGQKMPPGPDKVKGFLKVH